MAEQGRQLLLKRGDAGGPEVFTTIGGLRSKDLTINGETVESTNDDSAGWRELLEGAGVSSMDFSGSGIVKGDAIQKLMVADAFAKTLNNYEVIVPGLGTFTGAFQISNMTPGSGEHNGEVTFSASFVSSGVVTFVAV